MEVKQIQDFINSISKQAYGETGVIATDLTGLIAMGDSVISSADSTNPFLNALVDRIGKTVISSRVYNADRLDIMMNTFDFGCILQKITVQPMEATEAPQWDLTEGESVDQYVITKPAVNQKLFTGLTVWEMDITIPDYQFRTAFTSFEAMGAFIDSIFTAMSNSLNIAVERYGNMAIANFIAEKIYEQQQETGGIHAINVLEQWNETHPSETLTAERCFENTEFMKFSTRLIKLYVDRLTKPSKLFNADKFVRFTPREDLRVMLLADYSSAVSTFLQADTFHKELVELPLYREIMYWQGSGQEYTFGETSLIDITTSDGHAVKQSGVIGLICDIEAIGMTCDYRRVRSSPPNAKGEYTNYFSKADMRYYNDMSENGVVFYVADTE